MYVIYNINASSSRRVVGFHYPEVLSLFLVSSFILVLVLLEPLNKVAVLVWQHKCLWQEVELVRRVFGNQVSNIEAQSVLPCDLVALWEVIDLLVFV